MLPYAQASRNLGGSFHSSHEKQAVTRKSSRFFSEICGGVILSMTATTDIVYSLSDTRFSSTYCALWQPTDYNDHTPLDDARKTPTETLLGIRKAMA